MFKKMGFNGLALALAAVVWLLPDAAQAAEISGGNTAWILTSTALVLFMTLPGLALFYAGLVQSKNVLSVMMHCFTIACLVSVLWLLAGYSIAFAEGNALEFHYAALPDDSAADPLNFSLEAMRGVYDVGRAGAVDGSIWR